MIGSNQYDAYAYEVGFKHGASGFERPSLGADRFYRMGFAAAITGRAVIS